MLSLPTLDVGTGKLSWTASLQIGEHEKYIRA